MTDLEPVKQPAAEAEKEAEKETGKVTRKKLVRYRTRTRCFWHGMFIDEGDTIELPEGTVVPDYFRKL